MSKKKDYEYITNTQKGIKDIEGTEVRIMCNQNTLKGYGKKIWILMILLVLLQKESFMLAMTVLKIS